MTPRNPGRSALRRMLLVAAATFLPAAGSRAQEADPADAKLRAFVDGMRAGEIKCPLDPIADIPAAWNLTPDRLDELFAIPEGIEDREGKKNPHFEWLTTTRERAHFIRQPYTDLKVDLSLFDGSVPVEEVIVDFLDTGKLNGVTVSVYNRGDASAISGAEFDRRMKICGQQLSALLDVRPVARKANPAQGLLTEGWLWFSGNGMAILEHNPEATAGQPEFLRMRIAPRDAEGSFAAAMRDRSSAVKLSDLPRNVVTDAATGDVHIKGVPMVDQGPKGYCVVATCQRLLEYYGIPCDQHQIAQIAGSDAQRGTSNLAMSQSLEKIDYRFKTRFTMLFALMTDGQLYEVRRERPAAIEDFEASIRDYVDRGIPLIWSLEVGKFPEEPNPPIQGSGGHTRLITGYNTRNQRIVFTDTWGAGHEKKYMLLENAFQATQGLYVMHPTTR